MNSKQHNLLFSGTGSTFLNDIFSSTAQTPIPTTTRPPECLAATNLSEYWRRDNNGTNIKPGGNHSRSTGYACDLHKDLKWFRFTGDAGMFSLMLLMYGCLL